MRLSFLLIPLAALGSAAFAQPQAPAPQSERAKAWWGTVAALAADDMEGREAGSEREAEPGGEDGARSRGGRRFHSAFLA